MPDEPHGIAEANRTRADDRGVEGEPVVKAPDDIAQDSGIDLQRAGVDRGHVTALAKGVDADVPLGARPVALAQPLGAADQDVGAQPPDIAAERAPAPSVASSNGRMSKRSRPCHAWTSCVAASDGSIRLGVFVHSSAKLITGRQSTPETRIAPPDRRV
jgi:hypothetical protein